MGLFAKLSRENTIKKRQRAISKGTFFSAPTEADAVAFSRRAAAKFTPGAATVRAYGARPTRSYGNIFRVPLARTQPEDAPATTTPKGFQSGISNSDFSRTYHTGYFDRIADQQDRVSLAATAPEEPEKKKGRGIDVKARRASKNK